MYEPEQFPGLIHRMLDPKTVILLFSSGKLVCTGAKKEPDVYRSVNNLHALLRRKRTNDLRLEKVQNLFSTTIFYNFWFIQKYSVFYFLFYRTSQWNFLIYC